MNDDLAKLKLAHPATFRGVELFVRDTEIMFEAKIAFIKRDSNQLENCITKLEELDKKYFFSQNNENLQAQRKSNAEHRLLLREWLDQISHS